MQKRRVLELDSLRGIAALSVCFFHFGFFKFGIAGVELFFMISGFVIYMSIANSKNIINFWKARVLRLYPLYWVSIIIALFFCTACTLQTGLTKWNFIIGNLLILQPLFKVNELAGVYWTLYIEIMFYVFISIIWLFKLFKNIELIVLVLLLLSVAIHGIYLVELNNAGYTRFFIITRGVFPIISHFHFFAAGIIFFQIYAYGLNAFRSALILLSVLLIPVVHAIGGREFYYLNIYEHITICLFFYVFFILIIYNKASVLKLKFFVFFGNISYALYLVHGTFGIWLAGLLSGQVGEILSICSGIAGSILLAYILTFFYDVPIRKFIKSVWISNKKIYAEQA